MSREGQGHFLPLADDLPEVKITTADVHKVERLVCGAAADVSDARTLLDIIGTAELLDVLGLTA